MSSNDSSQSANPEPTTGPVAPSVRGHWIEVILLDTYIVLSLYVLSIGPLYWQWYSAKFVDGPTVLAAFYEPLFWAANFIPLFGEWLDHYIRWWIIE